MTITILWREDFSLKLANDQEVRLFKMGETTKVDVRVSGLFTMDGHHLIGLREGENFVFQESGE